MSDALTFSQTVHDIVRNIGGDPIVTYGHTEGGHGEMVALILTGDGVLIAVNESCQVESTLLVDQPWVVGVTHRPQ